jgi:tripartite-type tricarboxylate transporter receptor subunit TctC
MSAYFPDRGRIAFLSASVLLASHSHGAEPMSAESPYPIKPVRIVVPYAPGAGTDLHARALAQRLAPRLGQTVIVDNRAGANGTIAMEHVARSVADGHTLVYALPAQYAVNPALYRKLSYDPVRDFEPIMLVARTPLVLFSHPSVASAGNGSAGHLCLEMFRDTSATRILHVPYKGAAPSMVDLMSGQVQLSFLAWSTAGGHVKSGRLRALGVTSEKRATALPDLPAIAETLPGFDIANWYGLSSPKGTRIAVLARLNAELIRIVADTELRRAFEKEAIELIGSSPDAFGRFLQTELVKWGKLVQSTGLRID